MSFDFDPKPAGADDPTADFLERERQALGALGGGDDLLGGGGVSTGANTADDFAGSASKFPALDGEEDGFGSGLGGGVAPAPPGRDDLLGGFGDAPAAGPAQDSEKAQFESQYPAFHDPDLDTPFAAPAPAAPAAHSNGFSAAQSKAAPLNAYGYDEEDGEDPAPIKEWRSKQADEIAARNALAERKKGETISRAERETDSFYEEYNAKKEKTIAKNKENEAAFQAQREKDLAEGTTWQRVNKLLELQGTHSKTIAAKPPTGVSDTARMKEIYLALAKEGENAPGAAGY